MYKPFAYSDVSHSLEVLCEPPKVSVYVCGYAQVLGDLFESTLAALFVESGFNTYRLMWAFPVDVASTTSSGLRRTCARGW